MNGSVKQVSGMELVWPVEERPRQAGLPGFPCAQGGHKHMECAHLAPSSIDTSRVMDLCDQGGNAPLGDFTQALEEN